MKNKIIFFVIIILIASSVSYAKMIKVGQSGMTYLSITLSARESGMGNASTASVRGVQSIFYNPAGLASLSGLEMTVNQVNWLAGTKIIGMGAAFGTRRFGTIGIDLIYVDYGEIMGTKVVDKSVDPRGYSLTGNLNIQDYSVGLAYAYPVNDRFSFGGKIKFVHEDLGSVPIAVQVIDQNKEIFRYEDRNWKLNHWGLDFGGFYKTGFKDLALGVSFLNYSSDMQYWREAFQLPLVLKMGLAMDIAPLFMDSDKIQINTAIDALHPIDYTERVHIGTELVYLNLVSLRAGYQFNHDVENFSLGFGLKFDIQGIGGSLDYAYTNAQYFSSINRFSLVFSF
ncbi:MAG: PorV/PorQ family protein [Actinobacteria bacterium]|nr:PorV/PorQ family protein [Actinomycetota bacterium]